MNELALFAGAGGGILGGRLLGWECVCAVERDQFCQEVLAARQNDGTLPPFPIWDDVRTFHGHPWRGVVDILSGGFPCQDISAAGTGEGITGSRSGLWAHMCRITREVQPTFVLVENSPLLRRRGLAVVLGDLAQLGYDAIWGVFSARSVGAPHLRERMWILAYPSGFRRQELGHFSSLCRDAELPQARASVLPKWSAGLGALSEFLRMDDGLAYRLDAIKAIGNGQLPAVVETACKILTKDFS